MPEMVDQAERWREIQEMSDTIVRRHEPPSSLESALVGAVWRARKLEQLVSEKVLPLAYCILNRDGKMFWSESCIFAESNDGADELEAVQLDDPDAGWHLAPFYAAPQVAPSACQSDAGSAQGGNISSDAGSESATPAVAAPNSFQFDKQVLFSSWQDPRSWDVNAAAHDGPVITCATNADAKKAERLFNDLLARAEKAEAAVSATRESVLEEAAKVCEQMRPVNTDNRTLTVQRDTLDNAARLIRALKHTRYVGEKR